LVFYIILKKLSTHTIDRFFFEELEVFTSHLINEDSFFCSISTKYH